MMRQLVHALEDKANQDMILQKSTVTTPHKSGALGRRNGSLQPELMDKSRSLFNDLNVSSSKKNNFMLPAISPMSSSRDNVSARNAMQHETFGNMDTGGIVMNGQTKLFLKRINQIKEKMET